jgi:hypothetical protein
MTFRPCLGALESLEASVRATLLAAAGHDVLPSPIVLRAPRLD